MQVGHVIEKRNDNRFILKPHVFVGLFSADFSDIAFIVMQFKGILSLNLYPYRVKRCKNTLSSYT